MIASWTTFIHYSEDGDGLETRMCLNVDHFLDWFVLAIEISSALLHLSLRRWLESLMKESNERGLF